ncbi:MAG: hypothetical protein ACREJC_19330, partial [Tepidisphaeraceae bacterium]
MSMHTHMSGDPPPRGVFSPVVGALRRWISRHMEKDKLIDGLKTFAWVGPLTLLIWVYAEREQVWSIADQPIPISVASTDPSRFVRLRSGDSAVTATLIGPRANVDKVLGLIGLRHDSPSVVIPIDRSLAPGQSYPLEAARLLERNPIFRDNGVSVRDCKPSQIEVFVDSLDERDVEVRGRPGMRSLSGTPVFEPRTAKVRGPKSMLDNTHDGPLSVFAELADRDELNLPGPHDLAAVRLKCSIDDPAISVIPATVKATVDVAQSDVRYEIRSMPI